MTPQDNEIKEETIRMRMEYVSNAALMRFVRGVATMLELDLEQLVRYVAELSPYCIFDNCLIHDVKFALEDSVMRIYSILNDTDAWDAYSVSPGPSAYRYAATVALWFYLYAEFVGGHILLSCPLFGHRVAAAITEFLATRTAYPLRDAMHDTIIKTQKRKRQSEEEVLLHLCFPSSY